ncbi:MAG: S41 family peptidase [Bacteroidota bacterium]|jgi:hypothetical protein
MRSNFIIFLVLIPFFSLAQNKKADLVTQKFDTSQLKQDVRLLKKVILKMHPVVGIYHPIIYFDSLLTQLEHDITKPLTTKEFYIRLKSTIDDLQCGHSEVGVSKAYAKAMAKRKVNCSPYFFVPVHNKVYGIASISKKDTLIKKGDEILSINSISTQSLLSMCKKMITVDGQILTGKDYLLQSTFNAFYQSLTFRPDTYTVQFKRGNLPPQEVKYKAVSLTKIPDLPIKAKPDSTLITYKKAAIKHRFYNDNQICYLKLSRFSHRKFKKAYRKIFKKIEKNKTNQLILDLRDNGGGSLANFYRLISYFHDTTLNQSLYTKVNGYPEKKYTKGNFGFKITKLFFRVAGHYKHHGDTSFYTIAIKPNKRNHYNGKVVVLINGASFSASCLTAAYLKYQNRATFIGQETSGTIEGCNAGVTAAYNLPNTKLRVRVPAFRIVHDVSPNPTGHGIKPDIEINYGFNDLLERKDLELAKALELLQK